uniref:GDSL esterase/lipase n=1 Tax=Oryza barthii TaxID=65489 RepID=A0A0D3FKR4_9ORYZ
MAMTSSSFSSFSSSSSSSWCTLKQSRGICVALLALACCLTCAHGAVEALYVLGDSQADVGNNNYLPASLLKANYPHNGVDYPGGKPTGRFSNGYNFVDLLGECVYISRPFIS